MPSECRYGKASDKTAKPEQSADRSEELFHHASYCLENTCCPTTVQSNHRAVGLKFCVPFTGGVRVGYGGCFHTARRRFACRCLVKVNRQDDNEDDSIDDKGNNAYGYSIAASVFPARLMIMLIDWSSVAVISFSGFCFHLSFCRLKSHV